MAQPIVVVKENPGTLVVEVREKKGATDTLVAVLKLPGVKVNLKDGAKVNGKSVESEPEYRIELADVGSAAKRSRKKARKAKKKAKKKSGKSY